MMIPWSICWQPATQHPPHVSLLPSPLLTRLIDYIFQASTFNLCILIIFRDPMLCQYFLTSWDSGEICSFPPLLWYRGEDLLDPRCERVRAKCNARQMQRKKVMCLEARSGLQIPPHETTPSHLSLLARSLLVIRLLSLGVILLNLKRMRHQLFLLLDCIYRINRLLVLFSSCFPIIDDVQRGKETIW